ncbi:ATPase [Thiohalorhabdus denitrificans]|uniref:NMD3 family protein n=1 Tax=Thiohalorhabdus denitrificans TaxID=381306 RepID=A0A0P9CC01_9GAMM|nr:BCAM0308 family protein [Thiohalorhabdus denitrificans]KPV40466.1 ATPase [Thiohalorhabdus denitrificans]SCY61586.1 hypothetical protein SAMN05661077_2695 [Thiohalorhabdus denitrificans]
MNGDTGKNHSRLDKMIQEHRNDPYFMRAKYSQPAVCRECGVVFDGGIFQWMKNPPEEAELMTCPACSRIKEDYTGGMITLEGDFLQEHWEDIRNLIENVEKREVARRPLERIMEIRKEDDGSVIIRTTYEHLARGIADAIHRAHKGDLDIKYPSEDKYVLAHWRRDR